MLRFSGKEIHKWLADKSIQAQPFQPVKQVVHKRGKTHKNGNFSRVAIDDLVENIKKEVLNSA